MVNKDYWNSQAVTAHANDVNQMLSYMAIGCFFYDLLLSISFDYKIVTGKKKLRWVHLAYFSTKLSFLGFIAILFTIFWAQKDLHCQSQFQVLELFMGLTVFTSSTLLAVRTLCVFHGKEKLIIKVVLTVLGLGLLAAWMQGVNDVKAYWDTKVIFSPYTEGQCVWTSVASTYWVKYIFTIVFDSTVMVLTAVGITRMAGTSQLGLTLIHQGMLYFLLTFLANLIIDIFTLLNLSTSMSLLVAVPQSAICVICSCRLHRELVEGHEKRKELFASPNLPLSMEKSQADQESKLSKWDLVGQKMQKVLRLSVSSSCSENVPIQQLSYGRGFLSGTTGADNSIKSPPILSPYDSQPLTHASNENRGYFDVVRGSTRSNGQVGTPGQRQGNANEISFAEMLSGGPTNQSSSVMQEICLAIPHP